MEKEDFVKQLLFYYAEECYTRSMLKVPDANRTAPTMSCGPPSKSALSDVYGSGRGDGSGVNEIGAGVGGVDTSYVWRGLVWRRQRARRLGELRGDGGGATARGGRGSASAA